MTNSSRKRFHLIFIAIALTLALASIFVACGKDVQKPTGIEVTYHLNDGTDEVHVETDVPLMEVLTKYTPDPREGYNFKSWSTDENGANTFHPSTFKESKVDLYAVWEKKTFNVTFRINETNQDYIIQIAYDEPSPLPTAEQLGDKLPAGYSLIGWMDENGNLMDEDSPSASYRHIKADVTFTAKLVLNEVTVKFFVDGVEHDSKTGKIGQPIISEDDPLKALPYKGGFTFTGWFDDGGNQLMLPGSFTQNIRYDAKYVLTAPDAPDYDYDDVQTLTYGEAFDLPLDPLPGFAGVTYQYMYSVNDGQFEAATHSIHIDKPTTGSYEFTVKIVASADGYESVSSDEATIHVTVSKATLTLTIAPLQIYYGDELPFASALNISYDGFKFDETDQVIDKDNVKIKSNDYFVGGVPGEYEFYIEGLEADNYTFKCADSDKLASTLNVLAKPLNISLNRNMECEYGTSEEYTFEPPTTMFDVAGLLPSHTASIVFTLKNAIPAQYAVGDEHLSYALTIMDGSGDNVTNNYSVASISANAIMYEGNITGYTLPSDNQFTYDGTEHTFGITDLPEGCVPLYRTEQTQYAQSAPSFIDAGEYKVYFKLELQYYKPVESSFDVKVSPAQITVTAQPQSTIYGYEFDFDEHAYTIMGDNVDDSGLGISVATSYSPGDDAGNYDITVKYTKNKNVTVTPVANTLKVDKAEIEVTPNLISLKYGEALDHSSLISFAKPTYGKDPQISVSTTYAPGTPAGTVCEIEITAAKDNNYTITVNGKGSVTVTKRNVNLTLNDINVTYGDAVSASDYGFTFGSGDGVYDDQQLKLDFSTDYNQGDPVNRTYTVMGSATDDEVNQNYNITISRGKLTVAKRPVSVKVRDCEATYGEDIAANFAYDIQSGNFYGSIPAAVYSKAYTPGDIEGSISAEFADGNHDITVTDGKITVKKQSRTITINLSATHADVGTPYSHTFTKDDKNVLGLFEGDVLGGTLQTNSGEDGNYTSISDFNWSAPLSIVNKQEAGVNDYYKVNYVLNIRISKLVIHFSATGWDSPYDGDEHTGTIEVTEEGLTDYQILYRLAESGDYDLEKMPAFSESGNHTVYFIIKATGKTETEGSLTINITPRKAVLTAKDATVEFGQAAPALTYESSNIIQKDLAALNLSAVASDYSAGDDVKDGGYAITVTYAPNDNYSFTVVPGKLTVTPKAVAITLNKQPQISYGDSANGFDYGDYEVSDASAKQGVTFSTEYRTGNGVGDYKINASGSRNYAYTVDKQLKVVQRKATITLGEASSTYGSDPTSALLASVTYDNLYAPDRGSIAVTFTGYDKDCNTYTVTPSASNPNYDFTCTPGHLTVNKANLTLTLTQQTSVMYGNAKPTYSVISSSALVGGESSWTDVVDDVAAFKYTFYIAGQDALAGDILHVGSYDVEGSGLTSKNYNITYAPLRLTVTKASLFVALDSHDAIVYGDDVPTFSYTVTGWRYDDETAVELPVLDITCNYEKGKNAGSYNYSINVSNVTLADYTLQAKPASRTLTVGKATYSNISYPDDITNVTYYPSLTLKDIKLATGYKFKTETTHPTCNVTTYAAIYNGDPTNYYDYSLNITVKLIKGTPSFNVNSDPSADWTGAALDIKKLFNISITSAKGYDGNATLSMKIGGVEKTTVTDGGVYTVTFSVPAQDNWNAYSNSYTLKIKAAKIGNTTYTVEDALSAGGTITLFGNAFISKNVELKSGSVLNLPYDGANLTGDGKTGSAAYYNIDVLNSTKYQKLLLTIRSDCTLTVSGTLNVGGITGIDNGGYYQGSTSSDYARIHLEGTAAIVVKGTLDLHGFVTSQNGNAKLTVNSGATLKAPFVVHDFRGGSCTGGAYNQGEISPFNQYEMPNIQNITQTINSGAKVIAYVSLRTEDVDLKVFKLPASYNKAEATIISTSGALINLTSGSLKIVHTPSIDAATNNKTAITLNDESAAELGSLKMSINVAIATVDVDTSTVYFPIPYNFDITINNKATLTIPNKVKLLSGAKITVEAGGTLDLTGGGMIVYDANWADDWNGTKTGTRVYPTGKGAAQIIVRGTFNVGAAFGGAIKGEASGKVVVKTTSLSIAAKEGFGTRSGLTFSFTQTYSQTYNASLIGYSGSLSNGSTYTFNGSSWTKS